MVRSKTNLKNKYNVFYCYERGCNDDDQFFCLALGPCACIGGECPKKEPLTRLCEFFDEFECTKPIMKDKEEKKSWLSRLLNW